MNTFKASVQYGDWKGTAAADDADQVGLRKYLENHGLIQAGEFLIATSMWVGENHGKLGSVHVRAYLYTKGEDFDTVKAALDATTGPISVRVVDIDLAIEEFIILFKRFDLVITHRGLDLTGREFKPLP